MNAPKSAPNGFNPDLESANMLPLDPPEWKDEEEDEEDEEDEPVSVGNKEPRPPFVKPPIPSHPGPPPTSSTCSTGPSLVWTTVLLMVLVQLTVLVLMLTLGWPWSPVSSKSLKKSPSPRPESSVMDLDGDPEEEDEDEDEEGDVEWEVPGTLETVAGDELEPSSSRMN